MKLRLLSLSLITFAISLSCASADIKSAIGRNEWEKPEAFEWNKLRPHTDFMLYETEADAIADDYGRSPFYKSLNGTWKFLYASDVAKSDKRFYATDVDDSLWNDIKVPSNWELQGFGEPIIRNIQYVFSPNPPYIDAVNPVGTYRRRFTVPKEWNDKRVVLHFGSIAGYANIYVNGVRVGMTKAAKTPAEFDVTDCLNDGDNLLAVQVYRWHDGSYLEDQDFWRLTGIERDVYLQAYPKLSIWDFRLMAGLDDAYKNGTFSAYVDVRRFVAKDANIRRDDATTTRSGSLLLRLYNKAGRVMLEQRRSFDIADSTNVRLSFDGKVKNVDKWSAETPNLYDCTLTLFDARNRMLGVAAYKVGFRRVEIKGSRLLINGTPIYIKGVNRHEHNDTLGHTQTRETIEHDLRMMKRLNINAVRTSHYPNHPLLYKLCDKYGFYVVDEANIETHGMGSVPYFKDTIPHPAYRQEWYAAHVDRITRMVERDKNHACIIGWSMGNECGNGKVFHDEYLRLKKYDPTRFVQFEQAWEDWNTDVVCPMYPTVGRMKDYRASGKTRPYIMCEYAHAQGNSNGNFKDLWDIIYDSPNMQGGFIWDFMDQGFKMKTDAQDGRVYWMYNGGMGSIRWLEDRQSEYNTGTDGILSANGVPKPQATEVKKVYQYIDFAPADLRKNRIKVRNRYDFTNLKAYDFGWELCRDGERVDSGEFKISLPPHAEKVVTLDLPSLSDGDDGEYYLNIYAYTAYATDCLPAHYEVAREQMKIGDGDFFRTVDDEKGLSQQIQTSSETLSYEVKDNTLSFKSGDVTGTIDLKKGMLSYYALGGCSPISKYPEPAFWRAPTDNDFGNGMPSKCGVWRTAGVNRRVDDVKIDKRDDGNLSVKVAFTLLDIQVPYTVEYLIQPNGAIVLTSNIDTTGKNLPELPRFGMRMELKQPFEQLEYYGRGPQENYPDRKSSAFIGRYNDTATNQFYWYSRPQETGNKTDVRWLTLCNADGVGIKVSGLQPLSFSALHFTPEDLDPGLTRKLQHTKDIYPQKNITLHIDLKQRGLGGDNSWGMYPHNEYRLLDSKYAYSYKIELIKK